MLACCRYGWANDPAYAHLDAKGVELMLAHYELLSPMFPVQMLDLHKRLSRGMVCSLVICMCKA